MDKKTVRDLDAALSNLSGSLAAYFDGDPYTYLQVAVELRKLLCDTKRGDDNSLSLRMHHGMTLYPLSGDPKMIDEHTVFYLPRAALTTSAICGSSPKTRPAWSQPQKDWVSILHDCQISFLGWRRWSKRQSRRDGSMDEATLQKLMSDWPELFIKTDNGQVLLNLTLMGIMDRVLSWADKEKWSGLLYSAHRPHQAIHTSYRSGLTR
jgi:hypothetical protein